MVAEQEQTERTSIVVAITIYNVYVSQTKGGVDQVLMNQNSKSVKCAH